MIDYLDPLFDPYVAPLGRMVLAFGAADAGLTEMIVELGDVPHAVAMKLAADGPAEKRIERLVGLARACRLLDDSERMDLERGIADFYAAREARHRLIHDEFAPGWDEERGVVVVTAGRSHRQPNTVIYSEPTAAEVEALAARAAGHAKLFYETAMTIIARAAFQAKRTSRDG